MGEPNPSGCPPLPPPCQAVLLPGFPVSGGSLHQEGRVLRSCLPLPPQALSSASSTQGSCSALPVFCRILTSRTLWVVVSCHRVAVESELPGGRLEGKRLKAHPSWLQPRLPSTAGSRPPCPGFSCPLVSGCRPCISPASVGSLGRQLLFTYCLAGCGSGLRPLSKGPRLLVDL